MTYRILVADDHHPSRMALAVLLQRAGFAIEMAEDGRTALERLLQGAAFDLTLLDMHMPALTGLEVLAQIHASGLRVPSILMTGHPTREMEVAAMEAGAAAMLHKPIAPEILRITVERIVLRRGGNDPQSKGPGRQG